VQAGRAQVGVQSEAWKEVLGVVCVVVRQRAVCGSGFLVLRPPLPSAPSHQRTVQGIRKTLPIMDTHGVARNGI